jgi:UDP-N-acetylglucosamine 4-epimerase
VQANLLAATTANADAVNTVYNVAVGDRTTLNELFHAIEQGLRERDASLPEQKPVYQDFRAGDVRHSLADISRAQKLLGYAPTHRVGEGLAATLDWYKKNVT